MIERQLEQKGRSQNLPIAIARCAWLERFSPASPGKLAKAAVAQASKSKIQNLKPKVSEISDTF
jgi:hypothetical protein